ncbi:MAG: GntR family transcriptional regulator [Candidatus Aminicenantes bacterium]|nr:GntR family transcriptional regulator [Candidatus Aminicenantes bacterium]
MIKIDTTSFIPFYEQVKQQIKGRISMGTLRPGESLPSIRELATLLLINPNTVARAYRELEREGFICSRKGKGCFVTDDSSALIRKERTVILNQVFDAAIEEAKKLNLNASEIKKIFERRLGMRTSRPIL